MAASPLEGMTKDEVADLAAALFNYQLLGPTTLLDYAEKFPWLVERAPKRWEMEALLALARRGKTINEADKEYYALCVELRKKYPYPETDDAEHDRSDE